VAKSIMILVAEAAQAYSTWLSSRQRRMHCRIPVLSLSLHWHISDSGMRQSTFHRGISNVQVTSPSGHPSLLLPKLLSSVYIRQPTAQFGIGSHTRRSSKALMRQCFHAHMQQSLHEKSETVERNSGRDSMNHCQSCHDKRGQSR
jgi:hypothetical protein